MTEGGRVNRISVAVLVDGNYTRNANGEAAYQPREKEELDRIAALVRTAIGFDQRRGDQVEVVNLRFAEVARAADPGADRLAVVPAIHQGRHHALDRAPGDGAARPGGAADGGAAAGAARPRARAAAQCTEAAIAAAIAGGDVQGAIAAGATAEEIKAVPNQTAKMIDIAQVQGQVHAQSVQRVGELVDKNPNETVSIIRTWLHESAA